MNKVSLLWCFARESCGEEETATLEDREAGAAAGGNPAGQWPVEYAKPAPQVAVLVGDRCEAPAHRYLVRRGRSL